MERSKVDEALVEIAAYVRNGRAIPYADSKNILAALAKARKMMHTPFNGDVECIQRDLLAQMMNAAENTERQMQVFLEVNTQFPALIEENQRHVKIDVQTLQSLLDFFDYLLKTVHQVLENKELS